MLSRAEGDLIDLDGRLRFEASPDDAFEIARDISLRITKAGEEFGDVLRAGDVVDGGA